MILNPSASHFAFGKMEVRQRFVLEGSRAFGVSYVYSNLLGNEAGRAIYDGGALIAVGRPAAWRPGRVSRSPTVNSPGAQIDVARHADEAVAGPAASSRRLEADAVTRGGALRVSAACSPRPPALERAGWETGPHVKEEEFARAISLGLFDYLRKSRSHGFVVSLSGGADSSAVSCLVALMVELGVASWGSTGSWPSWLPAPACTTRPRSRPS